MPGQLDRMAERLQIALVERDLARRQLSILRLSLRRVAEVANQAGSGPGGGMKPAKLTIPAEGAERGWNRLCAALCDWIES